MLHRREFMQASAGAMAAVALPKAASAATWKTIDAQVHAYERNHPERPWAGTLVGPDEMTGDQMVAQMDAVGVDAAVLVSPYAFYRYDPSYVLTVEAKQSRFRRGLESAGGSCPLMREVMGIGRRGDEFWTGRCRGVDHGYWTAAG